MRVASASAPPALLDLDLRPLAELAALVGVFLLYSNAVVVAVNHNGVPGPAVLLVPVLLAAPLGISILRGSALVLPPALPWIVAFVIVQFAGALLAADPLVALGELATSVTEGLVLVVLVVHAFRDESALRRALFALLAAAGLVGGLVVLQQLTGRFDETFFGFAQLGVGSLDDPASATGQPRLAGPIGEENRFGQIMAVAVPIGFFGIGLARTRVGRLLVFAALLLSVAGAALSFSRGVAVGLALGFAILVALRAIPWRAVAVGLLGVVVVAIAAPQYGSRLATLAEVVGPGLVHGPGLRNADGAIRGRSTEMIAAGLMFADHPVVGVGPGMARHHYRRYAEIAGGKVRSEARQTHSLYLGLAAEHGLLGAIAFAGIVGVTGIDLLRTRRRFAHSRPDAARAATALLGALLVYLTTSLFLHMAYVRYFWLVLALAAAAGMLSRSGDAPSVALLQRRDNRLPSQPT